jgi:uncharacterized protein (TIGR02246 family)
MLASKYDTAINSHDPTTIAALYAQDAVWVTYHNGKYHGRQAIEKEYAKVLGPGEGSVPVSGGCGRAAFPT